MPAGLDELSQVTSDTTRPVGRLKRQFCLSLQRSHSLPEVYPGKGEQAAQEEQDDRPVPSLEPACSKWRASQRLLGGCSPGAAAEAVQEPALASGASKGSTVPAAAAAEKGMSWEEKVVLPEQVQLGPAPSASGAGSQAPEAQPAQAQALQLQVPQGPPAQPQAATASPPATLQRTSSQSPFASQAAQAPNPFQGAAAQQPVPAALNPLQGSAAQHSVPQAAAQPAGPLRSNKAQSAFAAAQAFQASNPPRRGSQAAPLSTAMPEVTQPAMVQSTSPDSARRLSAFGQDAVQLHRPVQVGRRLVDLPLLGSCMQFYCSCSIASPLQQHLLLQTEQAGLGPLLGLLGERCKANQISFGVPHQRAWMLPGSPLSHWDLPLYG